MAPEVSPLIDTITSTRVHALAKELRRAICHMLPRTEVRANLGTLEFFFRGEPLCLVSPLHSCVQLGLQRTPGGLQHRSGPPFSVIHIRESRDIPGAIVKLLVTV